MRSDLAAVSGLDAKSFVTFLREFRFFLRQPALGELELYIRTALLDKGLGLSDDAMFFELRDALKEHALYSRDAITPSYVNILLEKFQSRLLIPQIFPVDHEHLVEQKDFANELDRALSETDSGYLIVTGLPGSGKSTSLTTYFEKLSRRENEVFRYYCFVGVNDNVQRMRVRAASFHENLMSEFHRRYPRLLERRFDYSECNFLQCLETLGKHFAQEARRFVILLDGLDHAERLEPEIRDTVISALPAKMPEGVTIVVGTQELHKWPRFLKEARECPNRHISMPLFSEGMSEEYLCNKRGLSDLSHASVSTIHKKCEGLPLYLRYAAEVLIANGAATDALEELSPAAGGDIRSYYRLLWEEFDRVGMGNARSLCAVMACLRFTVHRDEFYRIQQVLIRPDFEDAVKCMSHLLRDSEGRLTVFHDSFREFVINQISDDWSREIRGQIASFLKASRDSPRWFGHVFQYSYEAGDYTYVLDEVNADFVDRALLHCRPSGEILGAINWAIESAYKSVSIVQLSRLGSLGFRTEERLGHNLDRAYLANTLLALGREQDVMSFAYSSEANRWLVEPHTALAVMLRLAEEGKRELGNRLFQVFTDDFQGVDSRSLDGIKAYVTEIARCLGIYLEEVPRALQWLSKFKFSPGTLEPKDPFAPGYAPHLEAYIDSLVRFQNAEEWAKLTHVQNLFANNLVEYSLIRALARHNRLEDLSIALSQYLEQDRPFGNVELAYYAAKIGIEPSQVTAIAGPAEAPQTECPSYIRPGDPMLRKYVYSCIIEGYNGVAESCGSPASPISTDRTLWGSGLRHLLRAGHCIGRSLRTDEGDWYPDAVDGIAFLAQAERGDGEPIAESIDPLRDVLPLSIGLLTDRVGKRYPERLTEWVAGLQSLRDSLLWTTHFGIGESIQDYSFELALWETLANNPTARAELMPILRSCAATYENSTLLKGGSRSDHFLRLAALMAKCDMRSDAEQWLRYGIRSSLIYGYHKDPSLLYLIEILQLINQRQPEVALERCASVLPMVDWMPHLTDGRGTERFIEEVFKNVLAVNRRAAFDLVRQFSRTKARWQMQDCLEEFIVSVYEGDPEYLWSLTELFSNHFSEDGRHSKQIMRTREHILGLVRKSCSEGIYSDFEDRYRHSVLTEITPRHWPEDLKAEFAPEIMAEDKLENSQAQPKAFSEFTLDGKTITKDEVMMECLRSFPVFLETIDKLRKQNVHFYEPNLIDSILRHHVAAATSLKDLLEIKRYVDDQRRGENPNVIELLAERFLQFGDSDNATACFGIAYACRGYYSFPWRHGRKYLAAVAAINIQEAKTLVLKECYDSAYKTGGGCGTPPIAATGLDVLDEPNMLAQVFSDFLTHCETLFEQLPRGDTYGWLNQYEAPSENANRLILSFLIDELETPEIDLGARLVRTLTRLAMSRPDQTIPQVVNRVFETSGRTKRRLLIILYCLAHQVPKLLIPHQHAISRLLDRKDFFCRQTALKTIELLAGSSPLDESVLTSVHSVETAYSHTISYSAYRLPTSPSDEFSAFLGRNPLFDFSVQVKTLAKILHVPPGSLIAAIEEKLRNNQWSMDEERYRIEDDWDGYVHPQGWPVVWITTGFHERAVEALWLVLDEASEKFRLTEAQIDRLWRVIQAVDPEYVTRGVAARPRDITPLNVTDKDEWLHKLDQVESFELVEANTQQPGASDWITVFEERVLAQDEQFKVPYRQTMSVMSSLIPMKTYATAAELDEVDFMIEQFPDYVSGAAVTLAQARKFLTVGRSGVLNTGQLGSFPLIAKHRNPGMFEGYRYVCSLASFIIADMGLAFSGLDLLKDNQPVAKYEVWQEGYEDECYTREKLSTGFRLSVRRDLLCDICKKYGRLLCTSIEEERMRFGSIHERKPTDVKRSRRYSLFRF